MTLAAEPAAQRPGGSGAGLYLHIPFCSAVCPYCDFAVQVAKPDVRASFAETLGAEIALWPDWPHPIDSVYFGGGTPSLLTPDELGRILDLARRHLPIEARARVFLEANPEDVSPASLSAWRELGVSTLSLGIQSFDDAELRRLGRRHDGETARRVLAQSLEAGFQTLSADLMFGLPAQRESAWVSNLRTVTELRPEHVSCYQLTVHPGTTFGRWAERGKLVEMPEDEQADFFALSHALLEEAGYEAYEVSNFARGEAHQSAHNWKYWSRAPYLGLGPSAHSFADGERWWNHRGLAAYGEALAQGRRPVEDRERLQAEDAALERLMLGLRTRRGIDTRTVFGGLSVDFRQANGELIRSLIADGLLLDDPPWLRPTVRGLAVADGLAARFFECV